MPLESNFQTTGTLAADIVGVWLADQLLERGEKTIVFYDLCDKVRIPMNNGQVAQFTRYERLPLPFRPLEEGVTPAMTPMTLSNVTAVLDQWGAIVGITDRAEMTVKHPTMQIARDLLSEQHDQTVDREIQVVLMGTSGVYFAGGKTSRANLTAADVMRTDDVRKVVATLRQGISTTTGGARPFEQGMYKGVIDPFVEADITKDPTFVNAGVFSQIRTLREFEIGRWMGVDWMRSNHIPIIAKMAASTVTYGTTGTIPAGATGFTATTDTVLVKATSLDPQTRFETAIDSETSETSGSTFAVVVTILSGAPTGIYRIYSTLANGASGTETLQVTVTHTTGTADAITLVKAGTGLAAGVFAVTPTGPVAPPDCPSTINVHISYVFGRGAVACTNLGDGLEAFYIPRRPSESDPLAQRAKASWKRMFKAVVTNPDFFRRIESASDFS